MMRKQSQGLIPALVQGMLDDIRATGRAQRRMLDDALSASHRNAVALQHVCAKYAALTGEPFVAIMTDALAAADNEAGEGCE